METEYAIKINSVKNITHDVKSFQCDKPEGYTFTPGQATEVSINKKGWEKEKRPFTFTSLNNNEFLEFIIKIYSDHAGVTNELNKLKAGDELIVRDVWGAIEYKGPGYFIAGGAGITPFIAILRQLKNENKLADNKLFFSNKTDQDIILKEELSSLLKDRVTYLITDEPGTRYHKGFINEQFLKENVDDFSKHFYVCGPPKMTKALQKILLQLGASPDTVIFEK